MSLRKVICTSSVIVSQLISTLSLAAAIQPAGRSTSTPSRRSAPAVTGVTSAPSVGAPRVMTEAERKAEQQRQLNETVEKILGAIDSETAACDFAGKFRLRNDQPLQILSAMIGCTVAFNKDLRFDLLNGDSQPSNSNGNQTAAAERFKTELVVDSKNVIVEATFKKKNSEGNFNLNFFTLVQGNLRPSPLTTTLAMGFNKGLLKVQWKSFYLVMTENPNDPEKVNVKGGCVASIEEKRSALRPQGQGPASTFVPAKCSFEGTLQNQKYDVTVQFEKETNRPNSMP